MRVQVLNNIIVLLMFIMSSVSSCSSIQNYYKQKRERKVVEAREKLMRNLEPQDTIESLFFYEEYVGAYVDVDVIKQLPALIKYDSLFNIKTYDTLFNLTKCLENLDELKYKIYDKYLLNTHLIGSENKNQRTNNPYCRIVYALYKAKVIIGRPHLEVCRVPDLIDCERYDAIVRSENRVYFEKKVWTYNVLGIIDYELLNINDYNIVWR